MIRLALSDLDSTLIPFGAACASPRTRAAIHTLLDAGLFFGPVSGRLPADMAWMFDGDERCYATGAFVNGMIVRVEGRVVYQETLDAEPLERAREALDACALGYLTVYDPWDLDHAAYVTRCPDRMRRDLPAGQSLARDVLASVRDFPSAAPEGAPHAIAKANVHLVSHEVKEEVRDILRAAVPELGYVFPHPFGPLVDITPRGWGKGDAVRVLRETLGLSPDEVVAFGDSDNDMAMISAVPNSVAVANATPEVKAAARWHIGPCDEGAVDDALLQLVEAVSTGGLPAFMR